MRVLIVGTMILGLFGCAAQLGDEELLASGQGQVFVLAADGDSIYWSGSSGATKLSLNDTNVTSYSDAPFTLGLAVDADTVYWATTTAVMMAPKSGGEPTIIAEEQRCVFAMVVDDEHLYWANFADGSVWSWSKSSGQAGPMWAQGRSTAIAVDDERVYWVDTRDGSILAADKSGGEPVILASDQEWPVSIAVDQDHAYWAARDGGVFRVELAGGYPEAIASEKPVSNFVSVLAVDEDDVYWVTVFADGEGDGYIWSVPKGGGETQVIGRANPMSIAADGYAVYWSTIDGDIVTRAK